MRTVSDNFTPYRHFKAHPQTCDTPMLVFTSHLAPYDLAQLQTLDIVGIIPKPVAHAP